MILTKMHGYQESARDAALQYPGFCLFPEQRARKTLTALSVIDVRKPDVLIIIGPKKAIEIEWPKQLKQHLKFDWDCQVEMFNFEISRSTKQRKYWRAFVRKCIKEGLTVFIVVDEAHRIKKRGSKQSRLVRSLGYMATYRLALTGTPIAQGLQDAWAIFDFTDREAFGSWDDFADRYLRYEKKRVKNGRKIDTLIGYQNEGEFNEIFHEHSYRITFNEARRSIGKRALRVRRKKVKFKLKPASRLIYATLVKDLEVEVQKRVIDTPLVITLALKLQQLAGGFLIHTERIPGEKKRKREILTIGKEKLTAFKKLLKRFDEDERLVVCARFTHELEEIAKILESWGITYKVVGSANIPKFKKLQFTGQFDVEVMLLQIQAGTAIDLSLSNTYIFYSWDHSYINYEQSKFRVISMDTDQVNYYYLMAEDTIDEQIYESVTKKKDLATLVCDKYRRK